MRRRMRQAKNETKDEAKEKVEEKIEDVKEKIEEVNEDKAKEKLEEKLEEAKTETKDEAKEEKIEEVKEEVKEEDEKDASIELLAAKMQLEKAKKALWSEGSAAAKKDVDSVVDVLALATKDLKEAERPDVVKEVKLVKADVDKVMGILKKVSGFLGKDWKYDAEDVLVDGINELSKCIKKLKA